MIFPKVKKTRKKRHREHVQNDNKISMRYVNGLVSRCFYLVSFHPGRTDTAGNNQEKDETFPRYRSHNTIARFISRRHGFTEWRQNSEERFHNRRGVQLPTFTGKCCKLLHINPHRLDVTEFRQCMSAGCPEGSLRLQNRSGGYWKSGISQSPPTLWEQGPSLWCPILVLLWKWQHSQTINLPRHLEIVS